MIKVSLPGTVSSNVFPAYVNTMYERERNVNIEFLPYLYLYFKVKFLIPLFRTAPNQPSNKRNLNAHNSNAFKSYLAIFSEIPTYVI